MNSLWKSLSNLVTKTTSLINNELYQYTSVRNATFLTIHRRNLEWQEKIARGEKPGKKKKSVFDGKPLAKGIVLRTLVKNPKKPNSANRKCVLVRLSTGKEMVAYVPGVGHNLQEHQTVLCRVSKLKDVPGVKIKCIRGAYDLPHVKSKTK